jgi:uncharacterized membrane protein YphA (DoxX/SURF4 family)
MEHNISLKTLKNAEILLRLTMSVTLLIAGISKYYSNGQFHLYYLKMFENPELRINLSPTFIDLYLSLIPIVEIGVGLALLSGLKRRFFIVVWILYFITLEVGHYILEEFTSVDLILPIILFGVFAYILPGHEPFWLRMGRKKKLHLHPLQ